MNCLEVYALYSGDYDIRTPDIRALRFTDDLIWEQIFYKPFFLIFSGILRSGSGRFIFFFTTKQCLTIKFALFNRMLRFADTPLQKKLSFTFCFTWYPLISLYKHPDFPNHFQFTDKDKPRFTARGFGINAPQVQSLFLNVLLNQENWKDAHSVVVYLPNQKLF